MTEFLSYEWYAGEWEKLGADFIALGFVANAAICFSNAKRYSMIAASSRREQDEASSDALASTAGIDSRIHEIISQSCQTIGVVAERK